jgi:hypothetical protein
MICDFCKKDFSSKSALVYHQKTAKYCLEIQGKDLIEDFKCSYCMKKFTTSQNLNDHISICKEKQRKELENKDDKINKEHNNEIKKIKEEHEKELCQYDREHKKEIDLLNQVISKLESKLESYEKRLFEMASRPNTTNTNNNKTFVINNTNLPLTNEVLRQCATTFTIDNARNIDGITKHLTSSLEDHITCTDPSRNIFKYINEKDEEIVDQDLENLIPQYLTAIKDRNNFLYKEVVEYFKKNNFSLNEQTDYNTLYRALNNIIEKNGQQNKYTERCKQRMVKECKKQFLEKNKNKEKEITKKLTEEEMMRMIIENGGTMTDFLDKFFPDYDMDEETDEQFEYRRRLEDEFRDKKREYKNKLM